MKTPPFRAVVLAAGLGTRLRPLTLSLPKPLLPVAGLPILGHTLRSLCEAGCEEVAINLHYQGEKIASRFGSQHEEMRIRYSHEEEIRGTLGALGPLRSFLEGADIAVVVNGDSLSRWPFTRLLRRHREGEALATLMVSTKARAADYGGGIGVARDGAVTSFWPGAESSATAVPDGADPKDTKRRVFAGAHAFSSNLLARMPDAVPSDFVRDLYQPLIESGEKIEALESGEPWFDLGTPRRYLDAVIAWAGRGGWRRRAWLSSEAEVDEAASVENSVIEAGVKVGAGARIRKSLVLTGASIGAGCKVSDSVIGFSVDLPEGTVVEKRMVTGARADMPPAENASVVGGLVYDRLDRAKA